MLKIETLTEEVRALGLRSGGVVMVHSSLRKLGQVEQGAAGVIQALRSALGPTGTLMAMVSWDRSPYAETLDGRTLPGHLKDSWPAFCPVTSSAYPGYGILNSALLCEPGVRRSPHPDASFAVVGPAADFLMRVHPFDSAYGIGSPLERFVDVDGQVLMLGAPLDAVTLLHYAEALAAIPHKRRVTYEMPVLQENGTKAWVRCSDFDSNGILDCYLTGPDAIESIARCYVQDNHGVRGRIGEAVCYLFEARHLLDYGVSWLESRHSRSK